MTTRARLALAVAAAGVVVVPAVVPAGGAAAASYRYWTYWTVSAGAWTFATTGPAYRVPADGSVEGWRFAVSSESGGDRPRTDPASAFAALCGSTPAEPGRKRVAVVIDTGEAADAPPGEAPPAARGACVVADLAATGYAVLRSTAAVRTDDGLVCGVDGYPAQECAVVVGDGDGAPAATAAAPSPSRTTERPSPPAAPTDSPATTSGAGRAGPRGPASTGAPATSASPSEASSTPSSGATSAPSAAAGSIASPAASAPALPAPDDPAESPVALVSAAAPPPPAGGSPWALLLVAAGAGALGLAAWLRTTGRRA